ncbi:MAG: hypothetical protein ACP5I7_04380 [Sulfolobales archaeon]
MERIFEIAGESLKVCVVRDTSTVKVLGGDIDSREVSVDKVISY